MHCEVQESLRTYYRNEKQKLSSFRSGTGAIDFILRGNTSSLASSSLDDTIQPLDSISNLDNMELEVNAAMRTCLRMMWNCSPIPNRAPSESELPQGVRVFTSTPPVTTSTPPP
ncbi:hypothetical protein TNCV_2065901 [Trichonephila clavipes]|nr:hypothetical protein TNCV_2065901 [Trichonephila clavipes]